MQYAAAPRLCPGPLDSSGSKLLNYSLGISNDGEYVFKLRISESEAQKSRGRLSGSAFHLSEEKIFSRKYRKIRAAEVMPCVSSYWSVGAVETAAVSLRLRYSNDNQRRKQFRAAANELQMLVSCGRRPCNPRVRWSS